LRNPEFRRLGAFGRTSSRWLLLALATTAAIVATRAGSQEGAPPIRSFEIVASRFKFEPALIEVTEGEEVNVILRSADSVHGFEIKELKVKVKIPKGGAPVSTKFVASKPGTFVVACSEYCGTGHRNMKARLVVAPRRDVTSRGGR
jgi:cytochrome c oxidase subunit II